MELGTRSLAQVRQATALLEAASKALCEVTADEAVLLARGFACAEKVAMAATRRAVLRAGDDGARRHGGERDMAALAATVTGTTLARAKKGLATAARAGSLKGLERAYVSGSLSFDQAAVIADTAATVPGAAADLVAAAARSSLAGLRAASAARLAAHQGEEAATATERRLVARRFCRLGPLQAGGVRLEALLPSEEGAMVQRALWGAADARLRAAFSATEPLSLDQARADALVALVTRPGTAHARGGAPQLVVTVDAAALVAGGTADGEVCAIEGVGPVPVATARGLLGEALLSICVKDGRDVRTVTSRTRVVPTRVRTALGVRDPTCVVPGCGARHHLEIDHWRLDFSQGGLSAIDNLCRLCPAHHRLKTRTGWRLSGGPGRWRWLAPRPRPVTGRRPPSTRPRPPVVPTPNPSTRPRPPVVPTPVPARE